MSREAFRAYFDNPCRVKVFTIPRKKLGIVTNIQVLVTKLLQRKMLPVIDSCISTFFNEQNIQYISYRCSRLHVSYTQCFLKTVAESQEKIAGIPFKGCKNKTPPLLKRA